MRSSIDKKESELAAAIKAALKRFDGGTTPPYRRKKKQPVKIEAPEHGNAHNLPCRKIN